MSNDGDVKGNHGGANSLDIWLVKLTLNGDIAWQKCYGGSAGESLGTVKQTPDNGFILVGNTSSSDGDSPTTNRGGVDAWVVRTDSVGNIIWQKSYGNGWIQGFYDVEQLQTGEYVFTGMHRGENGQDVSGTIYKGHPDVWVVKTSNSGSILWQSCYGGWGPDQGGSVVKTPNEGFFLLAFTVSDDDLYDVQGNHGNYGTGDIWLAKLGSFNTIKGKAFDDRNRNIIKDPEEHFVTGAVVRSEKPGNYKSSFSYNGNFANYLDTGNFVTTVNFNRYYTSVPASKISNFASYNILDSFDFALQPISNQRDLSISIIPLTRATANFELKYRIVYKNLGTDTIKNGQVLFKPDKRIVFNWAYPSISSSDGDTLKWNYSDLKPFDTASILVYMYVKPPPLVNIDNTLISAAVISPNDGDQTPADDTAIIKHLVTGSFDPNDKTENLGGKISLQQIASGIYIDYLIRFQNTGNDTAFNVVIRDTLDSKLDWGSIEVIGSSHPYELVLDSLNQMTWRFKNILLVDSVHNEPESHGFVAYRIKPRNNLIEGDIIRNSASIYFDFNLPVKTNTQETVVVQNAANSSNLLDPTISSFIPASAGSGTPVTIVGSNFTAATSVSFGSMDVASFIINSDTSITAIVGSGGSGNVSVTTSGGKATVSGFIFIPKPTITSFTATSGKLGSTITIIGTNLSGATNVSFGGVSAESFKIISSTRVTAIVGTGASGDVTVTTPGGTARLGGFTYYPQPTIVSFTPTSGGTGSSISITGTNLLTTRSVSFGNISASSFKINSSTSISATVGAGASGNVSVTTVGGTATAAGFTFTNITMPTITSFTPSSGAMGSLITINGTNLTDAVAVSFGGIPASSFTVNSPTNITATVGAGASGNVAVTNAGGTATIAGFTFIPAPIITSFTPTSANNGASITITGTNFAGATAVSFGGTPATSFTVNSATSITAVVGAGTSGNVSVTTTGGTATLSGFIFIPAPTITSFGPTSGMTGASITITGSNFNGATAVRFGGTAATSFTVNSATSITAVVGTGASGTVSVTTAGGTATLAGFTFIPAPTITSFTPASGAAAASITITGTNFSGATAVSFGGIGASSFTVNSAISITAVVGTGASGDVSVTTPGGTATLSGFTFIPAPTITSFTPTSGGAATSITITGTNFTGATSVSFGGIAATSITVTSATSITATVGTGASGSVSVTTPGGTATLAGFTFTVITAIDPVLASSLGIRFYPNPTSGSFVIDTLKLSDNWETLEIFDTQGKKKLSNFAIRNKTRVNVNVDYLSNGLYMAILKRRNGPATVIKFLKL